jgi:hypothetical protein
MIGSIFIASLAQNDQGMVNLSGLSDYLVSLLHDLHLDLAGVILPALYADGIFAVLPTIVPRYTGALTENERAWNKHMASVRVSIEHILGLHHNLYQLFHMPMRLRLFSNGGHVREMLMVSFLILNCYTCLNHSRSGFFGLVPPTLEEYLPIDEDLMEAPVVTDEDLGVVFDYGQQQSFV